MKDQHAESPFIISRSFETTAAKLFSMWTDPDLYTRFMGPAGAKMSFLHADITDGGTAFWQMTLDGSTKYGKLHFKTIRPPNLLVYVQHFCDQDGNFIKAPFSDTYPDNLLLTVDFNEEAGDTVNMHVKWEIYGESTDAERNTFHSMKPYMVHGWGESFDKMEALLSAID